MRSARLALAATILLAFAIPSPSYAWGGLGHRTVAAIAALLIKEKAARLNTVLGQLEADNTFVDAASYPDEFIRNHDPGRKFTSWHFADLPDDNSPFTCGECLFKALPQNLAIVKAGKGDKDEAVAIAWVIHLVGDMHQPLHMEERLRGGNNFNVKYRGHTTCSTGMGGKAKVELHSAWDDCLVAELAAGRTPQQLAKDILGNIKTYKRRPEIAGTPATWGNDAHGLAKTVAFDSLHDGDDLEDPYIKGDGKALSTVQHQLLVAGIRLAFLLDQNAK